jgi:glutathione S-transferase
MKLYLSPGACSFAPHVVLRELDVPFEPVRVDLKTHQLADGRDYYSVNPRGYVPALELDDGWLFTENAAILQYLGDLKPGLLAKAGTMERYRTIEWLTFISSELHKGFGPLFDSRIPDAAKQIAVEKLEKRFALLDRHFADRDYLMGGEFTVADAYAYTVLDWTRGMKIDLGRWPHLEAYVRRVGERPKVREAARTEKEKLAA